MPAMRAQASAIYIGVITIVASLGPIIVSVREGGKGGGGGGGGGG